jgi:hypothetical protein
MLVGSLDIYQKNNKYYIDNVNQDDIFLMLIDSFQLDGNDFSTIFSLSSLKEYMKQVSFNNVTTNNLLRSLYQQLDFFRERNYSISFMDVSDIMVINNDKFLFCNADKLLDIKNGKILITQIYDKSNIFLPPEFITNDTIPFSIDYSSFYYSLGIMVLHCLQQKDKRLYSFEEILDYYKEYNFYFTISQCLNINPSKRKFIIF